MRGTRFSNTVIRCTTAGLTLVALSLLAGGSAVSADNDRSARLRIVKDCDTWSGVPGSTFCHIVRSNVPELPADTKIYYDQISDGPTAGPGFLDSNVFVYVNDSQWAVGRCTVPNDNGPGLCTLTDGVGSLAGLHARIVVTYKPGGSGFVYAWNGTYKFRPLR